MGYQVIVHRGVQTIKISAKEDSTLLQALLDGGIYVSAPCGGKGRCGKCAVRFESGATEATAEDKQFFDESELAEGYRLACESRPEGDCVIALASGDESDFEVVSDFAEKAEERNDHIESAYQIAIDIGSTTLAISLVGRDSGNVVRTVTRVNRQRAFGADVISRIQASNDGQNEALKNSIRKDLADGITALLEAAQVEWEKVERIAIAGNTTMGHLFMGFSCEGLGVVPFTPVDISTIEISADQIFEKFLPEIVPQLSNIQIVLVPGISTYVGADITAGILACNFDEKDEINVLVDLGTNGEMAIGNKDRILVTSTAAGPAFEGGNISCGMGSVAGAICAVEMSDGELSCRTIGDKPMIGLCGTGVIETVYELVKEELVDETGMLDEDYFDDGYQIGTTPDGEPIVFTQKDVREIQLAKSAVRAGLETLILQYGVKYDQISHLYLAGGFGFKMNLQKAIGIGLLPEELADRTEAIGNSSLAGAVDYLTKPGAAERATGIAELSQEVSLATDKNFNQFYMDYMYFE